jgi:RNA polymerase sigma-70 factor (ECF subfamily)
VAGDVVRDAWLAVIKGLDRFEQRASLKTWISHVAVNRANTRGGRDLRTVAFSGLPADEDDDASPSVPQQRFQRPGDGWPGHWAVPPRPWRTPTAACRHWRHARTWAPPSPRCPAVQHAVLTLRDVEGLPSEEVCELLDLSAGNQRVIPAARAPAREPRVLPGVLTSVSAPEITCREFVEIATDYLDDSLPRTGLTWRRSTSCCATGAVATSTS